MRRILTALAATAMIVGTAAAQTAETTTTETFVTAKPTDVLSYNLVNLNVTNNANEAIGEIKDLILSDDQLTGYIVSVGGFLGMGDRYVIVSPKAVKITYVENDKKWTAVMDATKDQLKTAPEFKYEGRWER
ncbi:MULTISPECIES: PRC-barrel domain-containing protein [unclassified Ensifer]|uniref:PRC-barrel domain-containing protein n=1 Tax=unclassified Ensifer TaxID=2633371 RepID=UPI00070A4CD5|nr:MULTISPECIES: PRC-barrel domain-containing protein [unclassified Ensifer]KQW52634.1 photosystem reaction center subunit H [Ensifer sp. Root1252]KRC71048.1 photosystem reaction center subunit H [Ensifer sp. Root231]KRC96080.1 photosystem reaction center subunit H [Ensifer sp. Root258]